MRDIQNALVCNFSQNDMVHKILQDLDLGRKRLGRRPARRHIYCRLQLQKINSEPECQTVPPPSLVKYANVFRDQEERLCFWSCLRRDSASLESRDDFVFVCCRASAMKSSIHLSKMQKFSAHHGKMATLYMRGCVRMLLLL